MRARTHTHARAQVNVLTGLVCQHQERRVGLVYLGEVYLWTWESWTCVLGTVGLGKLGELDLCTWENVLASRPWNTLKTVDVVCYSQTLKE